MRIATLLGKILLLAIAAGVFFIAYTMTLPTTQGWVPVGSRTVMGLGIVGNALFLALAWGGAFAFPLAIVYGRWASGAAALVALPVAVVFVLSMWERPGQVGSTVVNSAFPLALLVLVPLLAHGAHVLWRRHAAHRALARAPG